MAGLAPLEALAASLARLPGVGRRSAERMALAVVRDPERLGAELVPPLARGEFTLTLEAPEGTPLSRTDALVTAVAGELAIKKAIDKFYVTSDSLASIMEGIEDDIELVEEMDDDYVRGRVGSGGGSLEVDTGSGDVRLVRN